MLRILWKDAGPILRFMASLMICIDSFNWNFHSLTPWTSIFFKCLDEFFSTQSAMHGCFKSFLRNVDFFSMVSYMVAKLPLTPYMAWIWLPRKVYGGQPGNGRRVTTPTSSGLNSSHIFSRVPIQDTAKWQFCNTTQWPSLIPVSIIFTARGPTQASTGANEQ